MANPDDHIYILKQVKAKLMLDSLPRYRFIDSGTEKEKRTLVSGLSYTIKIELFDKKSIYDEKNGLPDIDEINIDNTIPAIGSSSWASADTLNEWFLRTPYGYTDTVSEIQNKTYYFTVPTAPGPDTDNDGVGEPPENTDWLKLYDYPKIDVSTPSGDEGVDYVSVADWDWKITHAGIVQDTEINKLRRIVFLKGKWKYLEKRNEFEVTL